MTEARKTAPHEAWRDISVKFRNETQRIHVEGRGEVYDLVESFRAKYPEIMDKKISFFWPDESTPLEDIESLETHYKEDKSFGSGKRPVLAMIESSAIDDEDELQYKGERKSLIDSGLSQLVRPLHALFDSWCQAEFNAERWIHSFAIDFSIPIASTDWKTWDLPELFKFFTFLEHRHVHFFSSTKGIRSKVKDYRNMISHNLKANFNITDNDVRQALGACIMLLDSLVPLYQESSLMTGPLQEAKERCQKLQSVNISQLEPNAWGKILDKCKGFNPEDEFILLFDDGTITESSPHLETLFSIRWAAIFDFNKNHSKSAEMFARNKVSKYTVSSLKIEDFRNGFEGHYPYSSEKRTTLWMKCETSKTRNLSEDAMTTQIYPKFSNAFNQIFECHAARHSGMTYVVVLVGKDYSRIAKPLQKMVQGADRIKNLRVVVIAATKTLQLEKKVFTSSLPIEKLSSYALEPEKFLAGLQCHFKVLDSDVQHLPTLQGIPASLSNQEYASISQKLEIWIKPMFEKETRTLDEQRRAFAKGSVIPFGSLEAHHDINRPHIYHRLKPKIIELANRQGVHAIQIFHQPGAGATTLVRRVLWDLLIDQNIICCRLLMEESSSISAAQSLHKSTGLPVVIYIESATFNVALTDWKSIATDSKIVLIFLRTSIVGNDIKYGDGDRDSFVMEDKLHPEEKRDIEQKFKDLLGRTQADADDRGKMIYIGLRIFESLGSSDKEIREDIGKKVRKYFEPLRSSNFDLNSVGTALKYLALVSFNENVTIPNSELLSVINQIESNELSLHDRIPMEVRDFFVINTNEIKFYSSRAARFALPSLVTPFKKHPADYCLYIPEAVESLLNVPSDSQLVEKLSCTIEERYGDLFSPLIEEMKIDYKEQAMKVLDTVFSFWKANSSFDNKARTLSSGIAYARFLGKGCGDFKGADEVLEGIKEFGKESSDYFSTRGDLIHRELMATATYSKEFIEQFHVAVGYLQKARELKINNLYPYIVEANLRMTCLQKYKEHFEQEEEPIAMLDFVDHDTCKKVFPDVLPVVEELLFEAHLRLRTVAIGEKLTRAEYEIEESRGRLSALVGTEEQFLQQLQIQIQDDKPSLTRLYVRLRLARMAANPPPDQDALAHLKSLVERNIKGEARIGFDLKMWFDVVMKGNFVTTTLADCYSQIILPFVNDIRRAGSDTSYSPRDKGHVYCFAIMIKFIQILVLLGKERDEKIFSEEREKFKKLTQDARDLEGHSRLKQHLRYSLIEGSGLSAIAPCLHQADPARVFTGFLQNRSPALITLENEFDIPAFLPKAGNVPMAGNVTFKIGFSFLGPIAYDVHASDGDEPEPPRRAEPNINRKASNHARSAVGESVVTSAFSQSHKVAFSSAPPKAPSSNAPPKAASSSAPQKAASSSAPQKAPSSNAPPKVASSSAPQKAASSSAPPKAASSSAPPKAAPSSAPPKANNAAAHPGPSSSNISSSRLQPGPSSNAPPKVTSASASGPPLLAIVTNPEKGNGLTVKNFLPTPFPREQTKFPPVKFPQFSVIVIVDGRSTLLRKVGKIVRKSQDLFFIDRHCLLPVEAQGDIQVYQDQLQGAEVGMEVSFHLGCEPNNHEDPWVYAVNPKIKTTPPK